VYQVTTTTLYTGSGLLLLMVESKEETLVKVERRTEVIPAAVPPLEI
jgi:hypothetical protein